MKHALIPLVIFVLVLSAVVVGICECAAEAASPATAAFTDGPCECCDSCEELSSTCFSEPEALFLESGTQTASAQYVFEQLMRVDPALLVGGMGTPKGFELFPAASQISFFISHHQFRL